jgi:DNA-binding XRE family transcriptional regulator
MKQKRKSVNDEALRSIGRKLLMHRVAQNLTREMAAQAINISPKRLEAIERGETNYNLTLLVKMCEYYNVNILDVVD